MKNIIISALPLLAIVAVSPAWGQAPIKKISNGDCIVDDEGNDLGCFQGVKTIIVTGSALADPIGDDAYSITSVDLDNAQSERIENILRETPGLQQFRRSDARSANPTSQGITLRGLGGNASSRTLLILDGVPQQDPFGGWVSWPGYDAVRLVEGRVRRGGGAGSDGPGALSGTVEFGAAYGSRDSVDGKAAVGRNLGGGHISASASYARGDGFTPVVERQRGAVDRGAEYEQAGLALRAVAPLSDDTEIQASGLY